MLKWRLLLREKRRRSSGGGERETYWGVRGIVYVLFCGQAGRGRTDCRVWGGLDCAAEGYGGAGIGGCSDFDQV
jgi:hypothetical protein